MLGDRKTLIRGRSFICSAWVHGQPDLKARSSGTRSGASFSSAAVVIVADLLIIVVRRRSEIVVRPAKMMRMGRQSHQLGLRGPGCLSYDVLNALF
jgi:hypothetical protein